MKLIIVRHAEAEHNIGPLRVIDGPSHLTEKGRAQVARVADRLRTEQIDAAFSSDTERALDTARGILQFHPDVSLSVMPELGERRMGEMEGKTREIFRAAAKEQGVPWYEYRPAGGESMTDTRERARQFVESIREKNNGKTVLIVSHQGFIRALLMKLLKHDYETDPPIRALNAGVTVVEVVDSGSHVAHVLNDVSHLDAASTTPMRQ